MGEITRSCLLTARDLGRGWKTTQRWYEPKWKVKRPLIDGGVEEDGASISTIVIMGSSPDGVKTDMASHLLLFKSEHGQIYLRTAGIVMPAETNARARPGAYADEFRRSAAYMSSVFAGWQTPREEARMVRITTRQLKLPVGAVGVQTRISHGDGFPASDYRDVVIQYGRIVAGFSARGHEGDFPGVVDVTRLATLVAERLKRAAAQLGPSRVRIPVFTPDPAAESVARAALMKPRDYPPAWRDHEFAEYGPDSGTSVKPGSWLLQLDELRPESGMLARAVADEGQVGWSHYIRHQVAVYRSERRAKTAARDALARSQPRGPRARRRGSRVTARPINMPALDGDVHAVFRIKTWHRSADKSHPAIEVTSTDTAAVIRRGRMVVTYALAAKGEDVETAYKLLKMVVRKLERAERRLHP